VLIPVTGHEKSGGHNQTTFNGEVEMADIGLLILRLSIGIMFMGHGMQKLFGFFGGPGINGFAKFLTSLGFAPPVFWAYVSGCTELVGGLFLVLGLFTRGAAGWLCAFILIAFVKVHLKNGFFLQNGGVEYTFIIASVCIALALMGGGKYSVIK
jgi:putative oxidoreductase